MNVRVGRKSLYYIIFLPFFIFLMLNIDWFNFSYLKNESDVFQYIYELDSGDYKDSIKALGTGDFLFSLLREPLWIGIALALNNIADSNFIFTIIIPSLILFSFSFYIYFNSKPVYILALIHPIALTFYFNQLRLALAISVFLLTWSFFSNKKKVFLFSIIAIFIHTSSFVFLTVFYLCFNISKSNRITNIKKLFLFTALGLVLAYLTGPAISDILGFLGDRRADVYASSTWQVSFITSLYCMTLLILFHINYYSSNTIISFEASVSIVFLSLVFFSYFFVGGYPFRFFSAVFPIAIVGGFHLIRLYRTIYFLILAIIGFYIGFVDLNWGLFFE